MLLVAVGMLAGSNAAWATDFPYSVGSFSDGYRGSYSDPYTVEAGQTLHLTFVNNNNGTSTIWNNFIVEATSAVDKHDGVYFDMRADNYDFAAGGTFVQAYNGNKLSDLDGATVDLDVTYAGGVITVEGIYTKAKVTTYHSKYTYTVAGTPASVVVYLTEEAAKLDITKAEISSWTTMWSTDFSSAPSGLNYTHPNGTVSINNGTLLFYNGSNGDRTATISFDDDAFEVSTNWVMEFDWGASSPNTNSTNLNFTTDKGTAFSIAYDQYDGTATIKNTSAIELTSTLPINNYAKAAPSTISHFKIEGEKDAGIYLSVTCGGVTYVNKQLVSATYGYPVNITGTTGKAQNYISYDNIIFKTPTVAGYVATPTYTITAPDGTNRKFTLDCVTDGATIYYSASDLAIDADGWLTYSGEVTTSDATIYTYAKKGSNTSEKTSFSTGAGTAITLNAPTLTVTGIAENSGVYYPVVTIASDQSGLELVPASPTLTYSFNGGNIASSNPYTFTTTGTLEVTVSADGFTSNTASYVVEYPYIKIKTIDLQGITASELSSSWKLMAENVGLQGTWSSPYNGTTYSRYWYDVTEESGSRITLFDGLEGWYQNSDGANKSYYFYPGLGLVVPLTTQKDDGTENGGSNYGSNNHALTFVSGTANQLVTWKYGNNYGKNADKTDISAGNVTHNLYRYSDILTKVEAYSIAIPVEITSAGWATLYTPYALDFSGVTGLTAYTASVSENTVTLTEVTNVPANTGVVLKGAENTYSIPVIASSLTEKGDLKGSATEATACPAASGTYYILTMNGANAEFNPATSGEIAAGKAYLHVGGSSRSLSIVFSDATGISSMQHDECTLQNEVYNLNGQRVAQPRKGLYIVNGKKTVIR